MPPDVIEMTDDGRAAIRAAIRLADEQRRPYSVWQSTRTGRFFTWPAAGLPPLRARYLCPVNPSPRSMP